MAHIIYKGPSLNEYIYFYKHYLLNYQRCSKTFKSYLNVGCNSVMSICLPSRKHVTRSIFLTWFWPELRLLSILFKTIMYFHDLYFSTHDGGTRPTLGPQPCHNQCTFPNHTLCCAEISFHADQRGLLLPARLTAVILDKNRGENEGPDGGQG